MRVISSQAFKQLRFRQVTLPLSHQITRNWYKWGTARGWSNVTRGIRWFGVSQEHRNGSRGVHARVASAAPDLDAGHPSTTTAIDASCTYLQELYINSFALIDEQTLVLHPGLNVITGEPLGGLSALSACVCLQRSQP
jgi:hypothetical protein